LIGIIDVVDVANECAVAVGEDRELWSGICEARVEPDVFHVRGLRLEGGELRGERLELRGEAVKIRPTVDQFS
jgi:hypothetical protein